MVYFYSYFLPKTKLEVLVSDAKLMAMACEGAVKDSENLDPAMMMLAKGGYETAKKVSSEYINSLNVNSLSNEDRDTYIIIEKFLNVLDDFAGAIGLLEPQKEAAAEEKTEVSGAEKKPQKKTPAENGALSITRGQPADYHSYLQKYIELCDEIIATGIDIFESDEYFNAQAVVADAKIAFGNANESNEADLVKEWAPKLLDAALDYLGFARTLTSFNTITLKRIKSFVKIAIASQCLEYGIANIYEGDESIAVWTVEKLLTAALVQCMSTDFEKYKIALLSPGMMFSAILETFTTRIFKKKHGRYLTAGECEQMLQMSDVDALKLLSKAMQMKAAEIIDVYPSFDPITKA